MTALLVGAVVLASIVTAFQIGVAAGRIEGLARKTEKADNEMLSEIERSIAGRA